jgi:hypothetical protein
LEEFHNWNDDIKKILFVKLIDKILRVVVVTLCGGLRAIAHVINIGKCLAATAF